jgi:hypothetical protein
MPRESTERVSRALLAYLPIEDYGLIGDLYTVALVGKNGYVTLPRCRLNERALSLLVEVGLAKRWRTKLGKQSQDQDWSEGELDELLDKQLPKLGPTLRKRIKDMLAIVAYQSQHTLPVVELLVCDDAPQGHLLTAELALCGLYEWRHYKKLMPRMAYHHKRLKEFGDTFWKLYHQFSRFGHFLGHKTNCIPHFRAKNANKLVPISHLVMMAWTK